MEEVGAVLLHCNNSFLRIALLEKSGCFAVSSMLGAENTDWAKIRATLDRYIQGGLDALESEGVIR